MKPPVPPSILALYTTEERLERAEAALEAFWNKLESLGWKYKTSPASWVEQALVWIEDQRLCAEKLCTAQRPAPSEPGSSGNVQFYCRVCSHYRPASGAPGDVDMCSLKKIGTAAQGTCSEWNAKDCCCPRHPETGQRVGLDGSCKIHGPKAECCETCAHFRASPNPSSDYGLCKLRSAMAARGINAGSTQRHHGWYCSEWKKTACTCTRDPQTQQQVKIDDHCLIHGALV